LLYLGLFYLAITEMRIQNQGFELLLWLLVTVWATDTAAYIGGITIGGRRIAPSISPKKTWSGFISGVLVGGVVSIIFGKIFPSDNIVSYAGIGWIIAIVAQIGDLFESVFKRKFGVKDSGALIPGHGGILD